MRACKNDSIYFFGDQQIHGGFFAGQFVSCAAKYAVVTVGTKLLLQIVDRLGKIDIGTVSAHDPDGLHGIQPQTSRKCIRSISIFIDDCHYLLTGCLADMNAAI